MDLDFIEKLENLFFKGYLEDEFDLFGHKWKMRTLSEKEAVWRDSYIELSVNSSFLSGKRVPTLAVAIQEIDGKSIVNLFGKSKKKEEEVLLKEMLSSSDFSNDPRFIAASEFKKWLDSMPVPVVDALYTAYSSLEKQSEIVLKTIAQEKDFFRSDQGQESVVPDEVTNNGQNEVITNR